MGNDFGGITINLKLDEGMPVIGSSNLEFEKMSARTYQYVSDILPEGNLEIVIDENWWQNILSRLRSPCFFMAGMLYYLERVWKNPDSDLEKLSRYRAVLSPDFSMYLEMAPVMQR